MQDIRESREPPVFPLEKLLLSILTDSRVSIEILKKVRLRGESANLDLSIAITRLGKYLNRLFMLIDRPFP